MSDVTVYGMPVSTFVRTACMALAEKGVPYTLQPVAPHSPEIKALHPFGKIPALRHGDLVLFESLAITRYIDEAFDGPALQPADPVGRAVMSQWIGACLDEIYGSLVRRYLMIYFRARFMGAPIDPAEVAAALPEVAATLRMLDAALDGKETFTGTAITLADLFLLPMLAPVQAMPENTAVMAELPNLSGWYGRMAARPSAISTEPPAG